MSNEEFISGIRYLIELRPSESSFSELRYWTHSQLAEALTLEAMAGDPPEVPV